MEHYYSAKDNQVVQSSQIAHGLQWTIDNMESGGV